MNKNSPDILLVIPTFNRAKALTECIRTLFLNIKQIPDKKLELWFLDDASDEQIQHDLIHFSRINSGPNLKINIICNGMNEGIGRSFQTAFQIIKMREPKICGLIESDYFFRSEALLDVLDVFELAPNTLAISGMDHYDGYQEFKYNGQFIDLMKEYFGRDIISRQYYYKNFNLQSSRGPIEVRSYTNSCGCQFIHWERLDHNFREAGLMKEFWKHVNQACKVGEDQEKASDGELSCTITFLFEIWARQKGIDLTKNFAYLDILPSLAFHASNGGKHVQLDPNFFPECGSIGGINVTFPENSDYWSRKDLTK